MNKHASKRYGEIIVIFCLALLWFGTLQYRYLITPDEGRYAEIAREIVQYGDWLTPHLNGLRYFEKPPLQYWMSAFFFKILGFSDFTARLWPALTGFLAALYMGFVASRLWNKATGQIATCVLMSCVWWVGNGHFLTLDMGLSACLAFSMGSFLLAQRQGVDSKDSCRWMCLAWIGVALAVLSKGLIGIVIPSASVILYSLWQQDRGIWRRLHLVKGGMLFLAITAPWFIAVSIKNPGFAYFFFIEEHFARYATNISHREGAIYYFVLPLLLGIMPWLSFLPQAVSRISYQRTSQFSAEKFLLVWVSFIFLFFSLSSSKLPSYILPLFPALALLIARFLQEVDSAALRLHAWLLCLPAALLLIGSVTLYLLPAQPSRMAANQLFAVWLLAGGVVCMVCAAGAIWATRWHAKGRVLAWFVLAGLVAFQIPMLGHRVYGAQHTGYFLAEKIKPYLQVATPIYIVDYYDQTLPFYLRRTLKLVHYQDEFSLGLKLDPIHQIVIEQFMTRWKNTPDALAIMQKPQYEQFLKHGLSMRVIAEIEDIVAVKHDETY